MKRITLPYWGQIIGLVSQNETSSTTSKTPSSSRSLFITRQQSTQTAPIDSLSPVLYILDNQAEQFELTTKSLPCVMHVIFAVNSKRSGGKTSDAKGTDIKDTVIMLGEDGHLYQTNWQAKKITKVSQYSLLDSLCHQDKNSSDSYENSSDSDINETSLIKQLTYQSLTSKNSDKNSTDKSTDNLLKRPVAINVLKDALVILYPHHIVIWSHAKGKIGGDLENDVIVLPYLPPRPSTNTDTDNASSNSNTSNINNTPATALTTSTDGGWLVIGDKQGNISSYQWLTDSDGDDSADNNDADNNQNPAFGVLAVSSQIHAHEGKINALGFEPQGQYFFSAGADKKLLRTHVQGELHPLDRAKSSGHNEMITALCVSDSRLFSAGNDKTIKSWAFDKGQPNTCSDNLVKTHLLNLTKYNEQTALLAVGTDQSLRVIPVAQSSSASKDALGADKLQEVSVVIKDGYQRIKDLLTDTSHNKDEAFNDALALLKAHSNSQTLDIVNQLLDKNNLSTSQVLQLIEWIATTDLPKTTQVLEQQLNSDKGAKIRLSAFHALAMQAKKQSANSATSSRPLQYLETAINSKHEEIIASAIHGYLRSAFDSTKTEEVRNSEQRRLLPILQNMLEHILPNIRKQALASLEVLLPNDSPRADLIAVDSSAYDSLQAGLIRLYQRDMLDSLEVSRQLTQLQNHQNSNVRQTAFYVSLLARPELTETLKLKATEQGDMQFIHALGDFNHFNLLRGTLLDSQLGNQSDSKSRKSDNNVSFDDILDRDIHTPNEQGTDSKTDKTTVKTTAENNEAVDLNISTQDFLNQSANLENQADSKSTTKKATSSKQPSKKSSKKSDSRQLDNQSLEPLLQALANRHADISFRSAYALAMLQDKRAFGTLIRLVNAKDYGIRAGVAVALASLQLADAKSILPVLIDDSDAGVRQVAMRAYGQLTDDALEWASVGFDSTHQDIHEQALAIFLKANVKPANSTSSKTSKTLDSKTEMDSVLTQALNNPFASIRQEVVKVLLNRATSQSANKTTSSSNDGLINTIELLQQSLFEDVHQVAVEEWQRVLLKDNSKTTGKKTVGKKEEASSHHQALALLLSDTFINIRKQAFDIALKQHKQLGFSEVILATLNSPYNECRKQALTTLKDKAIHADLTVLTPALVTLFNDDSLELRTLALNTALSLSKRATQSSKLSQTSKPSGKNDANVDNSELSDSLIDSALNSPYPDIQLTVARLLASQSSSIDDDSRAYAVFKQYLEQPIPNQDKASADYKTWQNNVTQSLKGLIVLSHPNDFGAIDWYIKYLNHPDANSDGSFNHLAINLMWVASNEDSTSLSDDNTAKLLALQQDENAVIHQSANLALAVWGDVQGQHFFYQSTNKAEDKTASQTNSLQKLSKPLTALHWLQARHGLGITHANQLKPFFDTNTNYEDYRVVAQLLLVFADLHQATDKPTKIIEALPFADDETAVFYANILARYNSANLSNVWQYISEYLSRKLNAVLSKVDVDDALASTLNVAVDASELAKQKATDKQASLPKAILADFKVGILQKLMLACFDTRPLIKAKAIAVLSDLSHLIQLPNNNQDAIIKSLTKLQRSLNGLLDDDNINGNSNSNSDDLNKDLISDNVIDGINPQSKQPAKQKASDYQALAFGTLLGVIRESHSNNYYHNISTAEQAIRGLVLLTKTDADKTDTDDAQSTDTQGMTHWQDSTIRVLLPLLNHGSFAVRELAWTSLQQLDTPTRKLAEQAISTSHEDMVQRGLQLLLSEENEEDTKSKDAVSTEQLTSLLQSNNRTLVEAVYEVLKQRVGMLQASLSMLDIPLVRLRERTVNAWSQVETPSDDLNDKQTFLKQAIKNDDWQTQYNAFNQLIDFKSEWVKDETLFNALYTKRTSKPLKTE